MVIAKTVTAAPMCQSSLPISHPRVSSRVASEGRPAAAKQGHGQRHEQGGREYKGHYLLAH